MANKLAFLMICTLSMGGLGGSFQLSRFFIILSLLYILLYNNKLKLDYSTIIKIVISIYIIWLLYGMISLFWSSNPRFGFYSELLVMSIGMASILVLSIKQKENQINNVINAWNWGFLFTVPIALYEIISYKHFMYADNERMLGGINLNAPFASIFFGNWNNYCVYICLCFPFILWKFYHSFNKSQKVLLIMLLITALTIILINGSRGALIVLFIQFLIFQKLKTKSILKLAISLTFIVFLIWIFVPAEQLKTLSTLIDYRFNGSFGSNDESSAVRLNHVKSGIDYLIQTYGFGIGAGSFETDVLKSQYYMGVPNPHNIFIEIGVQYGVIVLLLFIIIFFLILYKYKKIKDIYIRKLLIACVITVPIIGSINSKAIGYTYWWVFINSLLLLSIQAKSENENINNL